MASNSEKMVMIKMDRQTQRAMLWKDAVYETIMGYLTIACDSQNLPATTKKAIMNGIEDMHILDMHDYAKLAISIEQTFWNINKTLLHGTTMTTVERMSLTDQLKQTNQVFVDRVREAGAMSERILAIIQQEEASVGGEAETK